MSDSKMEKVYTMLRSLQQDMSGLQKKVESVEQNQQVFGQNLQDLDARVAAQERRLTGLETQCGQSFQDISTQMAAQGAQSMTLPAGHAPPSSLPKLPPFRYNGDRDKFRGFVNQCMLYFDMHADHFPTGRSKVLCIIMLLTSRALAWANPMIESCDPRLNVLEDFLAAMALMFDDPNRRASAETALLSLRQGKRSVIEYATDFRRLAIDTNWDFYAQVPIFKRGLSSVVKDELARSESPQDLEAFIQHCVRIDIRLTERRQEKLAVYNRMSNFSLPPKESAGKTSRGVEEVPMQIDSVQRRGNNERREHRLRERLCFYCGQSDHFLINCPKCPKRQNKVVAAIGELDDSDSESDISECSLPIDAVFQSLSMSTSPGELKEKSSHCCLPIKILCAEQWISSSVMIDSGAGGNFMDISFAKRHGIQSCQKASPINLETVDGSPLISGPVDQETIPLTILLEPDHQEQLSFLLICSPHFPVILGMPWLRSQNPTINWETKAITFPTRKESATETSSTSLKAESPIQCHPDSDPTNPLLHAQFVRLNEAYRVLSKHASRTQYDDVLDAIQRENRNLRGHGQYKPSSSSNNWKPSYQTHEGPFTRSRSEDRAQYWSEFPPKRDWEESTEELRKRNITIVFYCFLVGGLSIFVHYELFSAVRDIRNKELDEQQMRILKFYNERKEMARVNGFNLQQEILQKKHEERLRQLYGRNLKNEAPK